MVLPEPHPEHATHAGIFPERTEQLGKRPRRVLVIAAQHGHHIEAFANGVRVPHLLIPTVALIDDVLEHASVRQSRPRDVRVGDFHGSVLRGIVDQENLRIVAVDV
jgi:hypothetical protein